MPVLRHGWVSLLQKEEIGGLIMGGFEPVAKPWGMRAYRRIFSYRTSGGLGPVQDIHEKRYQALPSLEKQRCGTDCSSESFTRTMRTCWEAPGIRFSWQPARIRQDCQRGRRAKRLRSGFRRDIRGDLWAVDPAISSWQNNHRYLSTAR
jgi:4-methylaminobutanoate oxidase (formaldehyde-forming)